MNFPIRKKLIFRNNCEKKGFWPRKRNRPQKLIINRYKLNKLGCLLGTKNYFYLILNNLFLFYFLIFNFEILWLVFAYGGNFTKNFV